MITMAIRVCVCVCVLTIGCGFVTTKFAVNSFSAVYIIH